MKFYVSNWKVTLFKDFFILLNNSVQTNSKTETVKTQKCGFSMYFHTKIQAVETNCRILTRYVLTGVLPQTQSILLALISNAYKN